MAISTTAAYFSGAGWVIIEVCPRMWSTHQKSASRIELRSAPSGPMPNSFSVFRISINVSRKGAKPQRKESLQPIRSPRNASLHQAPLWRASVAGNGSGLSKSGKNGERT